MSKLGERIINGLKEALSIVKGEADPVRVHGSWLSFNLTPDGRFMNDAEIIEDILANRLNDKKLRDLIACDFKPKITAEEKKQILKSGFNFYAYERVMFGRWIRNSYGLWHDENPHVVFDPVEHPRFPDQVSADIIVEITRRLKQEKILLAAKGTA